MKNQTEVALEVLFFVSFLVLFVVVIFSLAGTLKADEPTALSISSPVIYLFAFLLVMMLGIKIYKKFT